MIHSVVYCSISDFLNYSSKLLFKICCSRLVKRHKMWIVSKGQRVSMRNCCFKWEKWFFFKLLWICDEGSKRIISLDENWERMKSDVFGIDSRDAHKTLVPWHTRGSNTGHQEIYIFMTPLKFTFWCYGLDTKTVVWVQLGPLC